MQPSYFTPANDIEKEVFYYTDVPAMAARRGTRHMLVESEADTKVPGGLPIAIGGRPHLVNDHLNYAITWSARGAGWAAGLDVAPWLTTPRRDSSAGRFGGTGRFSLSLLTAAMIVLRR